MKDRTARHRTDLSSPVARLVATQTITPNHRILDYGCGYGMDACLLGAARWDPCYFPNDLPLRLRKYDVVLCTYVLNILPTKLERLDVMLMLMCLLRPRGKAYVTVRRDIKGWYRSRRGWQGNVRIPKGGWTVRSLWKTSWYETYEITKTPTRASKRRKR